MEQKAHEIRAEDINPRFNWGRALPALAAATRVWRDLFPAAEEVYTQGLRFMKEKWAAAGK